MNINNRIATIGLTLALVLPLPGVASETPETSENVGYGAYQATVGRVQLEEPSQFLNPTKNGGLK